MPTKQLVEIHWVDVIETCDWATEIINPIFQSVGWLISAPDAKFVQIATTQDVDGNFSSILSVPTGCVISANTQGHEHSKPS